MAVCPKCGRDNEEGRDFCATPGCGGYLRWAQTVVVPAVTGEPPPAEVPAAPAAQPDPAPEAPPPHPPASEPPAVAADGRTLVGPAVRAERPSALLAHRRGEDESHSSADLELRVEPGRDVAVTVLVRNQDSIVDNYDLEISGVPAGWGTATPPTVHLLPFSTGGDYEREVEIRLHPPRAPASEARVWPLRIVALSRAHGRVAAALPCALEIAPFHELAARVVPERAAGRRRARFELALDNLGNAPAAVALAGEDEQASLRYHFSPRELHAAPGRQAASAVRVRPPKPLWFGRAADRPFALLAAPLAGGLDGAEPLRTRAVLRQRPWVPAWALLLVPLLIVAAVVAFLLFFNRVAVPDLAGIAGEFKASQRLRQEGLELGKVNRARNSKVKPGTIFGQDVTAGEKVRKGSAVGIQVALGAGDAKVPDVVGRRQPQAEERLRAVGFQLGNVIPPLDDPLRARVVRQVPPAGERSQKGSPVTLYVTAPKSAGDGAGKLPEGLVGAPVAKALAALAAAGLAVKSVDAFSATVPAGAVISAPQPEGDEPVALTVSAGFPRIAYDDGRSLIVADGAGKKPPRRLPGSADAPNTQPAWSPDGEWIAFRRGDRLFRIGAGSLRGVRALTARGGADSRPAVSPDGRVVAFIRTGEDGTTSELCLIRVAAAPGGGSCLDAPSPAVGRPAWSADGRRLYALAPDDQRQVEVLAFTSRTPSSPRPEQWSGGSFVTDGVGHGDRQADYVSSVSAAPAGPPRLALLANWGTPSTGTYRLFVGPLDRRGVPRDLAPVGALIGCEVAWRSDGLAVAVASHAPCDAPTPGEVHVVELDGLKRSTLPLPGANPAWEPVELGR